MALACHPAAAQNARGRPDVVRRQLDSLFAELRADTTRNIKGVVVVRGGQTIAEAYFNGDGPDTLHDIRSATKSITSTLVGIAIDRHLIGSVDEPIERMVPRLAKSPAGTTTLRFCLTMRSGLDSDDGDSLSAGNENRLDESGDWLAFAAGVPRKWPEGARYVYSSLNAYLAGAVVEAAARVPLATFAERELFGPLGIAQFWWRRGPRGEGVGQGNLRLRLRDMAKIGELFLHRHVSRKGDCKRRLGEECALTDRADGWNHRSLRRCLRLHVVHEALRGAIAERWAPRPRRFRRCPFCEWERWQQDLHSGAVRSGHRDYVERVWKGLWAATV